MIKISTTQRVGDVSKLLTILPSIRESKQETIDSFHQTSYYGDIILNETIGSITEVINYEFKKHPNYDYYHIANDDFLYKTDNWDRVLIDKIEFKGGVGIAYANDGFNGDIPSIAVISGNLARSVGYLQLPTLYHLCGDMVWRHIGMKLNKLYRCNDVLIQHNHRNYTKVDDEVYQKTNSDERYKKDNEAYKWWLHNDSEEDLQKIRQKLDL